MEKERMDVDIRIQIRRIEERRLFFNARRCVDMKVDNEKRANPDRRTGVDRRCFDRRIEERRQNYQLSN